MITRAQMQRQLRNNGGIMTVKTIRKKYGLGSDLKSFVRKIIPNEIADIAVKAAPFVAPFNPGAAAIMRGVGRFDQRGSISDALKQGALTYAGGQGLRYLGGAGLQKSFLGTPGDRFTSPFGTDTGLGKLFQGGGRTDANTMSGSGYGTENAGKNVGIVQRGTDATIGKVPVLRDLPDIVKQQLFVTGITGGATALYEYFKGNFRPQEEGETIEDYLAARKEAVGTQMRTYMDNYFKFDKEYSTMNDAQRDAFVARYNVRDGGRIGYALGGNELPPDPTAPVNPFKPKPIGPVLPNKEVASNIENDRILEALFEKYLEMGLSPKEAANKAKQEFDRMSMMKMKDRTMADRGGVMGIPVRTNSEGIKELDMRKTGGFVPIGVKEKAHDVPAMLSKNEFVMTADAVRAAGGGSVQKGAQKMYDTMKKLESRVA